MPTPTYEIGQVLPSGAIVTEDFLTTLSDGSCIERVVATHQNGASDIFITTVYALGSEEHNRQRIHERAKVSLVNNASFLASEKRDLAAQVEALTRQVAGLTRLLLNLHDTTAGT